jgi:beta-lactamase regulating signal transducer with metallopeptidase domain
MNPLNPLTVAFRSALLHFVWQGLAVASLLAGALWLMRKRSANARYVVSCAALAMQAALPVWTTVFLYSSPVANFHAPSLPLRMGLIQPNTSSDWQGWALPLWLAGVLIFSIRLGWGYLQVAALRKRGTDAESALRAMVSALAERMGLSRAVRVLTASLPGGPSVIGWIKPVILIPAATIAGLTPEQLEMILAHELAHIRRFDYLVNLGQMLIETLLFYHPAVWWVSARIRQERELCCDDVAVGVCGNPISYVRALTALEKLRSAEPLVAMGVASRPLLYRIQRLAGVRTRDDSSCWAGILAISAALVCLGLSQNWARGQAPVPPHALQTPAVGAVKKAPATTKKQLIRIRNPWIAQVIARAPEPPKADPLPADLSRALKAAEYTFGWELSYLRFRHENQPIEVGAAMEKLNPRGAEINRNIMRLQKEAANVSSVEAREKIVAELRASVDELNKINQQLREARHEEGETRDRPITERVLQMN